MQKNKPLIALLVIVFSLIIAPVVLTSCGNSNENKAASDSTNLQPMDSSAMQPDTTAMDTASTRPVKSPN